MSVGVQESLVHHVSLAKHACSGRLTVLELRPIEAAFHAECVPDGSVWYSAGLPSESNPTTRVDIPNGRVPPLWVYFCCMPAIHRVM